MKKLLLILILAGAGYWGWNHTHRIMQTVNNGSLTAQVLAQIAKSKPISLLSIKISTNNGFVLLQGRVETKKDQDELVTLVQQVKGVVQVKNDLTLDNRLRNQNEIKNDLELTALIKKELITEEGLRGLKIHVEVNKGNVLLTGHVPAEEQAQLAQKIAKKIEGTKEVKNQIKISSEE